MRTVKNTIVQEIEVSDSELIEKKYLNFVVLSKKLADIEEKEKLGYKSLRNRLYNTGMCGKYNMSIIAGMKFIDVDEPMKTQSASLVLKFRRV